MSLHRGIDGSDPMGARPLGEEAGQHEERRSTNPWRLATGTLACPVCDTATGEQVRAGIMDDQFAFNLFATLLPFPFLVGIVAFIHFGGRKP